MSKCSCAALLAALYVCYAAPALAAGPILITQAKAINGNVTPGDAAGFPVSITRPGSYQFAGNLTAPAGQFGIVVQSPDVTIDLSGFRLHGQGAAVYGVFGQKENLTIRNGVIAGFTSDGIHSDGGFEFWTVEDMRILSNGRDGIGLSVSRAARIRNSTVSRNGRHGINCGTSCRADGNVAFDNGLDGLNLGFASIALNNMSSENAGDGVQTGGQTLIAGNQLYNNGERGVLGGGLIIGNNVTDNENWGIEGNGFAAYAHNFLYANGAILGDNATGVTAMHPNVCIVGGSCP